MGGFIVEQLAVGGLDNNFSYVIFADDGNDSAIVDPCGDVSKIKAALVDRCALNPRYILLTHGHHDHVSGVKAVKVFFDAPVCGHPESTYSLERALADGERLTFGGGFIECLYAPGHTRDGMIYRLCDDSAVFTGDTLFIDDCGFCAPQSMFETMRKVIFPLLDSNIVYSGHDYGHVPFAPLGELKGSNPYLRISDFEEFRKELKKLK
jgi:glyoxylase-like metal-dependent hydrolase (beta-lactamase superfamily II)